MRYSGRWMTLADDRILEYIEKKGSGAPKEMEDSGYVRYTRQHISRRCKTLVEHGLLRHLGNGIYVITEDGKKYLNGDLDTAVQDDEENNERKASA